VTVPPQIFSLLPSDVSNLKKSIVGKILWLGFDQFKIYSLGPQLLPQMLVPLLHLEQFLNPLHREG
jgi:hypothetical protein